MLINPMNSQVPSILIIYTGGTIGMVQKEGGALNPVKFDQILDEVPELSRLGYHLESLTFTPPIDSSGHDTAQMVETGPVNRKELQ